MYIETLSQLGFPHVDRLLASSQAFHEANNIPMRSARWDRISWPPRLTLDMVVLPVNQGHLGIGHGGFISAVLDDVAGFAGVTWAAEQDKTVLGKEVGRIRFLSPLPVYTFIRVVGTLESRDRSTVRTAAFIQRLDDHRVIAEGELVAKVVDSVRIPR